MPWCSVQEWRCSRGGFGRDSDPIRMTAGPDSAPAGARGESRDGTLEVDGPFPQANYPAPHRIADLAQRCTPRVVNDKGWWIAV